jgi:hypothetical protein
MTTDEKSKLQYVVDHISIAPDRIDYILHGIEGDKMSSDFKKYLKALWSSSALDETIGQIKRELQ